VVESECELRRCNAFEFGDLLACAVRLLGEHPHRLAWLRQRWRWILADEYRDTSMRRPRSLICSHARTGTCACVATMTS
jgi:superfamily I DNA/RNA helicase